MRGSLIILVFFLSLSIHGFGQNRTTKDGLKIGKWKEEYELASGKFKAFGFYKIIPVSTYDTIRSLGEDFFEIKYKSSTPLLFISGRNGSNISVKDSIWQTLNSDGKLHKTEYWFNGLNLWRKEFDDNGNLTEHSYDDFENDTSFYLTYKGTQLYKKTFYPPNNKNQQTEIFYPNNNLVIPDAEISFYSKFGDIAANVFPLNLSCKKDLTILSVSSTSGNIQVSFPYNSVPYRLRAKDTILFNLTFTPTPASFRTKDTVFIVTSEENVLTYEIYCSLRASHIDGSNVESIKQISLSKEKDKYLIVAPMGTSTTAFITDSTGERKNYRIYGSTKINLKELEVGEYKLRISSCHTGGDIKLTISE